MKGRERKVIGFPLMRIQAHIFDINGEDPSKSNINNIFFSLSLPAKPGFLSAYLSPFSLCLNNNNYLVSMVTVIDGYQRKFFKFLIFQCYSFSNKKLLRRRILISGLHIDPWSTGIERKKAGWEQKEQERRNTSPKLILHLVYFLYSLLQFLTNRTNLRNFMFVTSKRRSNKRLWFWMSFLLRIRWNFIPLLLPVQIFNWSKK